MPLERILERLGPVTSATTPVDVEVAAAAAASQADAVDAVEED